MDEKKIDEVIVKLNESHGRCGCYICDLWRKEILTLLESVKAEQPAGEFTTACRELIIGDDTKNKKGWTNEKGYLVWLEVRLSQACDRLDALEKENKEIALEADDRLDTQQQEIKEMTESAGFWGRSCARLWKKIDAQTRTIELLKAADDSSTEVIGNMDTELDAQKQEIEKLQTVYDQLQDINASHCERANWFEQRNKDQAEEIECWKAMKEGVEIRIGDMQAEINHLTAEDAQKTVALNNLKSSNRSLSTENKAQAERIEKLEKAIELYASHDENCQINDYLTRHPKCICTCGFEQALQSKEGEKPQENSLG